MTDRLSRTHYAKFRRGLDSVKVRNQVVAHFLEWAEKDVAVGDRLVAVGWNEMRHRSDDRWGSACRVISVERVGLLESLTYDEMVALGCDIETYVESWDEIHPQFPTWTNPLVLRVEFEVTGEYVQIPESAEESIVRRLAEGIALEIDKEIMGELHKAAGF